MRRARRRLPTAFSHRRFRCWGSATGCNSSRARAAATSGRRRAAPTVRRSWNTTGTGGSFRGCRDGSGPGRATATSCTRCLTDFAGRQAPGKRGLRRSKTPSAVCTGCSSTRRSCTPTTAPTFSGTLLSRCAAPGVAGPPVPTRSARSPPSGRRWERGRWCAGRRAEWTRRSPPCSCTGRSESASTAFSWTTGCSERTRPPASGRLSKKASASPFR